VFAASRRKRKDAMWNWNCLFNGRDITNQTQRADTRQGWVDVVLLDEKGNVVIHWWDEVARARWHGKVQLIRKER
jgi:hypothetical protein